MTTRTRHTPDGAIVSPLNVAAAVSNRDSLAKILYSKVRGLKGSGGRGFEEGLKEGIEGICSPRSSS